MNFISNIPVKAKLSILVGIALVSIVIIAWRGLTATFDINNALNTIVDTNIVRIKTAEEMTISLIAMQRAEKNMVMASTKEDMDRYEKAYNEFQKKFQEWAKKASAVVSTENRPKIERCIQIATKDYDDVANRIMKLTRENKNDEATKLSQTEGRKFIDECETIMNELIQSNEENLTITSKQTDEDYNFARNLVLGLSMLSLFGLLAIAYLVTSIITGSLRSVQNGLTSFFSFLNRETTKADLIKLDSKDEFGVMAQAINENISAIERGLIADANAVANSVEVANKIKAGYLNEQITANPNNPQLIELRNVLNEMLQTLSSKVSHDLNELDLVFKAFIASDFTARIKDPKGQVDIITNNLGDEISNMLSSSLQNGVDLQNDASTLKQAVESLSTASNQQAASLEETAAAMEEMTSNVQNNVAKSNEMATMAKETDGAAREGAILASRTASAMTEIQSATASINDAVAIIENIAFQTNILSLNAAVEAATAGEAGRGFAVVAQEVRNLANRSAEAAKEIKEMASQAANKSNEGMNIATELTRGFEVIASKIAQTASMVQDVSNANREQMQGIGQINTAVTQLDQMTQENAKVAAQADAIANATISKAEAMVEEAQAKEFVGKNNIRSSQTTQRSSRPAQAAKPVVVSKNSYSSKKALPKNGAKVESDVWESF